MAGKGCIDDNPFFIRVDMIIWNVLMFELHFSIMFDKCYIVYTHGDVTITPKKKKILTIHLGLIVHPRWKTFKRQLLSMRSHSDSKGFELKRPNDSIYTFPCPDCMCRTNKSEDSRPSSATWFGMKMFGGCSHLWFCEHTLLLTPLFCVGILSFFFPCLSWRGDTLKFWELQGICSGSELYNYFPGDWTARKLHILYVCLKRT